MLPGQQQQQATTVSPLVDLTAAGVCGVFETAYAAGGKLNTLALVERGAFLEATRQALNASGRTDVEVASSADQGCGLEYSRSATEGRESLVSQTLPDGGRLWGPADRENKMKKCWIHGSLWWIRHWVGAFLAEKAMQQRTNQSAVDELIVWLQQNAYKLNNDFLWISALHGALYQTIEYTGRDAPLRYPAQLAQRVCHDAVPNVYECRHGIGHGVLYSVLLRSAAGLADYSACRQPRPYSVPVTDEMFQTVWRLCDEANAVPTQNAQYSYNQGCVSGATHSGYLFDTTLRELGLSWREGPV